MGRPAGSKNKKKTVKAGVKPPKPVVKPVTPPKKVTKPAEIAHKKVELDPKIQRGLWPRYHAPMLICPVCGADGVQVDNKPHYPTKTLERFFHCSDSNHSWADVRNMGTGEKV